MRSLALPGLLLLLSADALAVRPPETTRLGFGSVQTDPLHPQRSDVQRFLASQPAWREFGSAEGAGWQVRFDEVTRTPLTMWGPGIPLGPLTDEAAAGEAVLRFAVSHAELFGVEPSELTVRSAAFIASSEAWYVDLVPTREGLPVWHSLISARIKQGKLTMVRSQTWPNAPVTGRFEQSKAAALRAHALQGPAPRGQHDDLTAERMLLGLVQGGKPELRAVWHTRSRTAEPLGAWEGFVDASTGELLHVRNNIRFFSGHLEAEHDVRLGDGELMVSPFRYARVEATGAAAFSDASADWSFPGEEAGPYQLILNGPQVNVIEQQFGTQEPVIPAGEVLLTADDFGGSQAALTTWVYLLQAQDWARDLAPEVRWSSERVRAYVNIDNTCNAYFDGDVNFFRAGSGCRNTGRLADVIFHEWGHGFHTDSIVAGFYDGSVGEGAADTLAFLMTDDSRIAPQFFTRGGALRDTRNNQRFPDDYETNEAFIHTNGLIFGGSMWDSREALRASRGEPYATDTLSEIYAGLLKGGPTIESVFDEAMFADDDDGDLSNGTPNLCELVEGFGKHGLGPAGGLGISPSHDPIEQYEAGEDAEVKLALTNPAPDCIRIEPETAQVHYRINQGPWFDMPLDVAGADIEGSIPGADLGDVVEYWVSVQDSNGSRYTEPPGGEIRPHTFYVGDVLVVRCDDFEEGEAGFSHELVSGEQTEGADDWQLGSPIGLAGDPLGCFSGRACWGNDLGGGQFNGEYQNDKLNRLRSRPYKTRHYIDTILQYRRWLSVEDGHFDRARITADGEQIWSNWATDRNDGGAHHLDDAWASHVLPLGNAGDDGEVRIAWEIESDAGLTFGGWTLDDVCILAPATPDNRLGVNDLVASRVPGALVPTISWTMPTHAPLTEAVLVRKQGSYPTGPNDGVVVARATSPVLGAQLSVQDPLAAGRGALYYAVYTSDGTDWLSWTREGLNAAAIEPTAGRGGCSSSPAAPAGAWVLLVALALRRRRS